MKKETFSQAILGMMHYYGVISISDLLVVCHRCGLCQLHEYKKLQYSIQRDLVSVQEVFLHKKLVCYKGVKNPFLIRDMQKNTIAGEYKFFSLEEYIKAGTAEASWDTYTQEIKQFLQENSEKKEAQIDYIIEELWIGLHHATDMVLPTAQCAKELGFPVGPEAPLYKELLEKVRCLSDTMPRWIYKGYSYYELCDMEEKKGKKRYVDSINGRGLF